MQVAVRSGYFYFPVCQSAESCSCLLYTSTDALLNRLKWKITASTNNSNAGKAIDDDASTRWDTSASQQAGQWVMVDMGAAQKLNRIILDTSKSPNDGPAGYELYLSTGEGDTWKLVASGKNAGSDVYKRQLPDFGLVTDRARSV